jgi:hypothetical protein
MAGAPAPASLSHPISRIEQTFDPRTEVPDEMIHLTAHLEPHGAGAIIAAIDPDPPGTPGR